MAESAPTRPRIGYRFVAPLLLSTAMLLWAGNFITGRAIRGALDPLSLNFWRWVLALLILLPLASPRFDRAQRALVETHWRLILGLGATGVATFNALVYLAVAHTSAMNAVLVTATAPSVIALLAWAALGERLSLLGIVGVAVSLFGAVVLVSRGDPAQVLGLGANLGDAIMIVAVIAWAIYSVLLKRRPAEIDPMVLLAAASAAGVAFMLPIWLWEGARLPPLELPVLAAIGYIALFASVFAFSAWNRGVALVGPARAGVYLNLLPVFGAVLAVLLLGERVELYHLVGAGLVFAGLLLPVLRGAP